MVQSRQDWIKVISIFVAALFIAAGLVAGGLQAQASISTGVLTDNPTLKVDNQVLQDTANGKITSFVVMLSTQANVSAAYSMKDEDARGWFVYNTLSQLANTTQAPLQGILRAQGAPFQSFWAANMIVTSGDRNLVNLLAARSDVSHIDSNREQRWVEPDQIANLQVADVSASPDTVEWGVQNVNAPQVWALGYTGQGMVVGNADTGMRWTQNALKPKYRGWNGSVADHNYNWHDSIHSGGGACGANAAAPCDDYGHGTHTTGTTVGDDGAGNQVGVAPGARWIGCRNMDQGNGTPATYAECFQFFIAPTDLAGGNPDPTLRPDVINNSWGCPTSEGCTTRAELETVVNNTQAAGIFVEASAGNSGSGCSSVTDPPSIYDATFATGAIDISNSLASFSSRGPSTYYTPNLLKPNVSAPGVNVRSTYYSSDTSYASLSGTSMAGPHVVGVVALLWSAHPELKRDIATTKTILQNTANPAVSVAAQTCGGIPSSQIPNNSFGYGRVDALAAVNSRPFTTPTPGPSATNTAVVSTATSTPTNTHTAVPTNTSVPTNTNTPVPTTTSAPTNTAVSTSTSVPTNTSTNTVVVPTSTGTVTEVPTQEPTSTGTVTTAPTETAVSTATTEPTSTAVTPPSPTAEPTEACVLSFTDVTAGNWFYDYVQWLYCRGAISGYNTSPPCTTGTPCFLPNNNGSRGQIAKMIVLGANLPINTSGGPHFQDVQNGSTFYDYIETLSNAGAISGYPCGRAAEPCGPGNLPYFRPNNTVTRGQFAKMDVLGVGLTLNTAGGPHFEDVASGSTFYDYVETLSIDGAINGYPCGGAGEPCGSGNLPYFRPSANVTRAQISKIIYLSVTTTP